MGEGDESEAGTKCKFATGVNARTTRPGVLTRHTLKMGRPAHEVPRRAYTHKHTQTLSAARHLRHTLTPYLRPSAVLVVHGGHLPRNLLLLCFVREITEIATATLCTEKGSNCIVSLPLRKGERRAAISIICRVHFSRPGAASSAVTISVLPTSAASMSAVRVAITHQLPRPRRLLPVVRAHLTIQSIIRPNHSRIYHRLHRRRYQVLLASSAAKPAVPATRTVLRRADSCTCARVQ